MKVVILLKELPRIDEIGHTDAGQHVVEFEMDDVLKIAEQALYVIYTPNKDGGAAKRHASGVGLQGLLWQCKKLFGRNK